MGKSDANKDDWRLSFGAEHLRGATVTWKAWTQPSPDWDHDHCTFCWAKFAAAADCLHEGYATSDEHNWICQACFNDFRERLELSVAG